MIPIFAAALLALAPAAKAETPPRIGVVAVQSVAQRFEDTLTLRGRTEAARRVEVRSEIAGLVVSRPLDKGARVKAGDVLCKIGEGDRPAELSEAEARLLEAEIEFAAADKLAERGFGAEMQTNSAFAKLEAAKARVLRARIDIDRLKIKAPFAGVLETDTVELGSLMQNGSTCAALIALNPIKMVAFAPESSVDALYEGAVVKGRLITGRRLDGAITHVARSADRNTRTYLVEAESPNPGLAVRDGMTTELEVALEGLPAHKLPQAALTLNDDGALGVRVVENGVARFAFVEILRDEPDGVWVAGLPEIADVIVVGQEFVAEGQSVSVEYLGAKGAQ